MKQQGLRMELRRRRFVVMFALVGALSLIAGDNPDTSPVGAVLGVVGEPGSAAFQQEGPYDANSAPRRESTPIPPILESWSAPAPLARSAVELTQPTPGVVVQGGAIPPAGATALFLGDSYTTGWVGAGIGARGWPRLVSSDHGWKTVNLAVAGTGFINPGWTQQPVSSKVSAAIRAEPDIIFIAAGHNDSRWTAAATAGAADKVIDRLRAALPDTTLVLVAPIWADGSPPQRCLDLRDHLRKRAREVGAIFIDPLAGKWFAGSAERYIGPDGIHPTDGGHRRIADLVLAHFD